MKIASAFLLVALSCFLDTSSATVPVNCLTSLVENGAPTLIVKLGDLLCKYQQAKLSENQQLYSNFLDELQVVLNEVGCTMDDLLGIHVVKTMDNVDVIADKVALVIFDVLNGLPLTTKFMEVACGTLEHVLAKLKGILESVRQTIDHVVNKLGAQQVRP
ncbi:hypothetical protein GDO81_010545 [Engystomops pustulosus]|uniref:Uncharacterized protein n=1 Tax=Engystomops pustulosus TaxID=76066 RepID=A0AAV7C2B8_ENGPU|nr:hypothetical protein GDO81_010545 [Engystomops pustulosus]